ncbi:MAG: hypothetical protein ACREAW_03650, partial [Nitrososphaera sp.]
DGRDMLAWQRRPLVFFAHSMNWNPQESYNCLEGKNLEIFCDLRGNLCVCNNTFWAKDNKGIKSSNVQVLV